MKNKIQSKNLLSSEFPVISSYMAPIVFPGLMGMIYSKAGVGKTYFAMWLMAALVSQGAFIKWKSTRPCRVLYLDGEMSGAALQARLKQIIKRIPDSIPPENLYFISPDMFPEVGIVPDLASKIGQSYYAQQLADIDLFLIDNLGCTTYKTNRETDEDVWLRLWPFLNNLRISGKAVIILHHAGKSGEFLGTSRLSQPLDWIMKLQRPVDYQVREGARFELHFEKARALRDTDSEPLELQMREYSDVIEWEWTTLQKAQEQRIERMLATGAKPREIAQVLSVPLFKVRNLALELNANKPQWRNEDPPGNDEPF